MFINYRSEANRIIFRSVSTPLRAKTYPEYVDVTESEKVQASGPNAPGLQNERLNYFRLI